MRSASKLIDDIIDEVQGPDITRAGVLAHLNSCNIDLASRILLPDLADGSGTITTAIDATKVAVPATFHRNIFLAQQDGSPVTTYLSLPLMIGQLGGITTESGNVSGICNVGQSIYYQKVPTAETDIELGFYRLPVAMTDSTSSYPDGITNNQAFDDCLFTFGCWRSFKTAEDWMEGIKSNTLFNEQEYYKFINELKLQCRKFTGAQAKMPSAQNVDTF